MKNKYFLTFLFFITSISFVVNAQVTEAEKKIRATSKDTIDGWKKGGSININLSQSSLTNWSAGGENSVAANGLLSLYANYKKGKGTWENYLDLAYGSIKQESYDNWRKSDDKVDFTSKFGRQAVNNWYYAVLFNFKTQMDKGYNYPDDSTVISKLLAPGYLLGSVGFDYKPTDNFSAYIAPITSKITIVNDDSLSAQGAFGVDPGEKVRIEFGGYARFSYKIDLMENITAQSKIDLFSNYFDNPGKVDINWEVLISMKVNKYISATLFTNLLYDYDTKIGKDENKDDIIEESEIKDRVQFKEVLGIGFSYKF